MCWVVGLILFVSIGVLLLCDVVIMIFFRYYIFCCIQANVVGNGFVGCKCKRLVFFMEIDLGPVRCFGSIVKIGLDLVAVGGSGPL